MATTSTDKNLSNRFVPGPAVGDDLDPRVARSRAKIIEAASEILIESGQRAVTVDAVAERSGVAKSTLYRHWSSRTELLVDVMRACIPASPQGVPDGPFKEVLSELLYYVADTLVAPEWRRVFPAIVSLKLSLPEVSELAKADHEHKSNLVQDVLDRGAAEGVIADGLQASNIAPLLLGPLLFATISDYEVDLYELADQVAATFITAHPSTD